MLKSHQSIEKKKEQKGRITDPLVSFQMFPKSVDREITVTIWKLGQSQFLLSQNYQ